MKSLLLSLLVIAWAAPALADVLINELASTDAFGGLDEDRDHEDWIELYNSGPAAIDLAGFGLSDDPDQPYKWVFPRAGLGPDSHLLVYASGKDRVPAPFLETVIDQGDTWRYRLGDTEPPADWHTPGFDDTAWSRGPSGFGYGDGDDATTVPPTTHSIYVRSTFQVTDPTAVSAFLLHVDYDDGIVAYLNGTAIARANITIPGRPRHDASAEIDREAEMFQGAPPRLLIIQDAAALLRPGDNVLALQVHDTDTGSSDLSLIPFLTLGYDAPPAGELRPVSPLVVPVLPAYHTNFKLSASGDTVILTAPGDVEADRVVMPQLYFDLSFGRRHDGEPDWMIFTTPTPAEPNGGTYHQGFSEQPATDPPPGFYSNSVTVNLSVPSPRAVIHYTLDGSEPTIQSPPYAAPLAITGTTVVRARAFEPGRLPGPIASATYFIDEATSLPVVSLTTEPANLFDQDTGIYVFGDEHQPEFPYFGANFWEAWERPVHVEFFETDGRLAFNLDAGVKIHGGWSRGNPQKSLRVIPRGGYGARSIDHRLFAEKTIDSFGPIILRNGGNDWDSAFLRDAIMHRATVGFDLDRQAYRPTVVFVNGQYWGIQNLRERQDEDYLQANHGVDRDQVDLLELWGSAMSGDADHYLAMIDFVQSHSLADPASYAYIQTQMDTDNFATYCAFEIYSGNADWLDNNVRYWRPRTAGGRWRWLFQDLDSGLGMWDEPPFKDTLARALDPGFGSSWPYPGWSTILLRSLMANPDFKKDFINRYADLMNSALLPENLLRIASELRAAIEPEMPRHLDRWSLSQAAWLYQQTVIADYIVKRWSFARQHVVDQFDLPGTYRLTLDVDPPASGAIALTAITIDSLWTGEYFLANPVALAAVPRAGFEFLGWSDAALPPSATIEIDPAADYSLTAVFRPHPTAAVVVNEINYNSSATVDPADWVELYNAGSATVDVSGWVLKDEKDDHAFTLPARTVIAPQGFVVLCQDAGRFGAVFPDVRDIFGDLGFGLSGDGEVIRLHDAHGALVDSVAYDDEAPWPTAPDGDGATLELIDPALDNALPASWAASNGHGTPGAANSVAGTEGPPAGTAPLTLRLGPIAPNPFKPNTRIHFAVPRTGRVSVDIYDVTGRLVTRLLDDVLEAGGHAVVWDAGGRTSGVYYVRVLAGADRLSRQLVLVK